MEAEIEKPLMSTLEQYDALPPAQRASFHFDQMPDDLRVQILERDERRRVEREAQRQEEYRRQYAHEQLRKLPQELLTTFDLAQHPCSKQHAEVMSWTVGKIGMMLVGPTGKGKSRSLLQVLSRLIWENVEVLYWPAPRLADKISALAFEDSGKLDDFIERLEKCQVLAIDDLGAHKPTERVCQEFHRVIDSRYGEGRPLLATTNCTPAQLQKRLLDEHGRTIRRLQEMTQPIHFAKSEPHASAGGPQ